MQIFILGFFILIEIVTANGIEQKKLYIVYLGDQPTHHDSAVQTHIDLLSSVKGSDDKARECIVHSYTKSLNAFAAKLSKDEAEKLSGTEPVLAVYPNRYRKLHTTKSWDFLGLPETAKRNLKVESDVIVGLLDTGITPGSESFNDAGFGPPPKKWKGSCSHFANFSGCNNKLIGAKYFKLDGHPDPADILSPVDIDGHGTHTSSTAVGSTVHNASLFNLAKGTARGAVPHARVAMYKVCWATSDCADMDLLAAIDAAVHDGVDILSISIGGGSAQEYWKDAIAIGAFHAMRKGVVTVASAGNDGPSPSSLYNHAPWILTVAASGTGRGFKSRVELGNKKTVSGVGVNTFETEQLYPLVSGVDVAKNSQRKGEAKFCYPDSMDPHKVKGKIVYCELGSWGVDSVVKGIGGTGIILESELYLDAAQIYMAPGTMVNASIGKIISDYIQSTKSPSAVVHKSQEVRVPASVVPSFSSRGPNPGSQRLLKPDIAAPGVDILAAYTPLNSLTGLKGDTQHSKFTLMSGTSMSCPHAAGVAAYVKSFHPNWTAAAIKSALLTTAKPMSRKLNRDAEFGYGTGQLNPARAISPGLIYDIDDMAYIQFLCHEGYNGTKFGPLIGTKLINCSTIIPGLGYDAINYPTMQVRVKNNREPTTAVFHRRVTNVGPPTAIYNATIKAPMGMNITIKPTTLSFTHAHQKRSFKVVVKVAPMPNNPMILSGSLAWKGVRHVVRSPIVVYKP